ncbi:PREDICTED: dehydrodolichyl diphosphate syntase complex subunit Nus1-like [Priapulus caudatus]|uniref:ditrans,polycis-polyprenyl diphosphate synthase [(2E,6E)-farnesyldiphosphate specific] n=1 Tax=Priapulus caudatus TaxID=37621 RepID=A0ABM1E707_PRICU|nr:PREDICTED: dehydrodolichyl diphosphate syntase complex subunit Nus1-like [Priapulus caudatus]
MSRLGVYLYQPHKEKGENGIHCRTRVRLLDGSNGKHDIVEAVRNVCIDVQHCKFKADSIDARKLEEYLNATEGLPDPGLLLAIGPVYSTSNYPPWQIRLTEIIYLKATHKLRYSDFLNSLRSFSKCEQRFGK